LPLLVLVLYGNEFFVRRPDRFTPLLNAPIVPIGSEADYVLCHVCTYFVYHLPCLMCV